MSFKIGQYVTLKECFKEPLSRRRPFRVLEVYGKDGQDIRLSELGWGYAGHFEEAEDSAVAIKIRQLEGRFQKRKATNDYTKNKPGYTLGTILTDITFILDDL